MSQEVLTLYLVEGRDTARSQEGLVTRYPTTTIRGAEAFIADRRPFSAGNLRGTWEYTSASFGQLPQSEKAKLRESEAKAEVGGIYVVYSYATPIAWSVPGQRELYVPDVKYSVTTSKHQNLVRKAA